MQIEISFQESCVEKIEVVFDVVASKAKKKHHKKSDGSSFVCVPRKIRGIVFPDCFLVQICCE